MQQYWPMAVALDDSGKPVQLFTYDSCLSLEKAREQFKCWQDGYKYKLLCTWIKTDVETEVIELRCHVNCLGQMTRV